MTPPDALKSAVRQLLKNPGFSAVAALTLALGAGPGDSSVAVRAGTSLRPHWLSNCPREAITGC